MFVCDVFGVLLFLYVVMLYFKLGLVLSNVWGRYSVAVIRVMVDAYMLLLVVVDCIFDVC